jgi:hypothetical protein
MPAKPRPSWSWRSGCRLLATLYPSWRAARLDPVEALALRVIGAMDDTTTISEPAPVPADDEDHPLVFLHGISRQFRQGDTTLDILKGAELAVWAGQSVALVAPSGAGKSTLLHIAGLLEHPDAGEVYIDGAATSHLTDMAAHPHPAHRYRLRLSVPSSAAGILGARERDAAADDPRPVAPRGAQTRAPSC